MGNQSSALHVFNRVLAIVVAWLALGIAAIYARDPTAAVGFVERYLPALHTGSPSLLVGSIAVSALAFIVLLVEIWPGGRREVFEVGMDGGVVEYNARVVTSTLLQALASVDVARIQDVQVDGSGSKVRLKVLLEPTQIGDPSAVVEQVSTRARETVKQLGLELQAIRLVIAGTASAENMPLGAQRQVSTPA